MDGFSISPGTVTLLYLNFPRLTLKLLPSAYVARFVPHRLPRVVQNPMTTPTKIKSKISYNPFVRKRRNTAEAGMEADALASVAPGQERVGKARARWVGAMCAVVMLAWCRAHAQVGASAATPDFHNTLMHVELLWALFMC